MTFLADSVVKNLPADAGDAGLIHESGADPLEKGMATTPVFLPGKFHGGRTLVGWSPLGRKESDRIKHTSTLYLNQYAVYTAGGNLKVTPEVIHRDRISVWKFLQLL